jgi:hypothetical protein
VVASSPATFGRQAARAFAAAPVQQLSLDGSRGVWGPTNRYLGQVRSLLIGGTPGEATLQRLLGAPRLAGLKRLVLSFDRCRAAGAAAAVSSCPSRDSIADLYLSHAHGVEALFDSRLPALRSLLLPDCRLGDGAVADLARSPLAGGLLELDLSRNPIGDRGARAILDSPQLAKLYTLCLPGRELSPEVREKFVAKFGACLCD